MINSTHNFPSMISFETPPLPQAHHNVAINNQQPPPMFLLPSQQQDPDASSKADIGALCEQLQCQQEELTTLCQQQQEQSTPMDTTSPLDSTTAQALQQMAEILKQSQDLNCQFLTQLASKQAETIKELYDHQGPSPGTNGCLFVLCPTSTSSRSQTEMKQTLSPWTLPLTYKV
jgi:hypothetical protein